MRVMWELSSRVLREPCCFKAGSAFQGYSHTMPSAFKISKMSAALMRKWCPVRCGWLAAG